jgi:YgiT-type zinc finger domain-containing protein
MECFECENKKYETLIKDYKFEKNGTQYVIKNVPIMTCPKCKDELISAEASDIIQKGLVEQGFKFKKRKLLINPKTHPNARTT